MENTLDASYRLPGIPERRGSTEDWKDRLDDWLALRKVPVRQERAQVRAGRSAELSMRTRLGRHHSTRFGEVFGGKRVPRRMGDPQSGRYEIDLIVMTPRRLHVIEVKNWSGALNIDGDAWVHDRYSGERKVFPDLVAYNQNKVLALQRYLAAAGVHVPSERVVQNVVFTNHRLKMDRRIEAHPNVVSAEHLERYLRQQRGTSAVAYALSALIQACAEADETRKLTDGLFDLMSPQMVADARAAIGRLQTWDRLQLHGGMELIGDLLWLNVADVRSPAEALSSGAVLDLRWRRGVSAFLPLFGVGPFGRLRGDGVAGRNLNVNDVVFFHEAGQVKPAIIALRDVDRICVG